MDYLKASLLHEAPQPSMLVSTGSSELNSLLGGGIHRSLFYYFYGEKTLIEDLLNHLTINALKPNEEGNPKVAYMLMNNYRKERVNLGLEELAELSEDSGFQIWEAMQRLRMFTASSADQQAQLTAELKRFLEQEENVSLVIVNGIFKLHLDDARKRERHKVWEMVQRSITGLRQSCMIHGVPLVGSGREAMRQGSLNPQPESSSYLRHTANVIVYLRGRQQESIFNRAYLLDHPIRRPGSAEYRYRVDETLGRETKPFRQSYQEILERLRKELREPLIDKDRKTAFDYMLKTWSEEIGAMSYAESFKILDLMLLVSSLENHRLLYEAIEKLNHHDELLTKLMGDLAT
jgi:hypothetical protein